MIFFYLFIFGQRNNTTARICNERQLIHYIINVYQAVPGILDATQHNESIDFNSSSVHSPLLYRSLQSCRVRIK